MPEHAWHPRFPDAGQFIAYWHRSCTADAVVRIGAVLQAYSARMRSDLQSFSLAHDDYRCL